eukprot:CAMPEP_0116019704 /NCGR_PEP_ID=MMETSP0321-20121206/9387_1 /TAXON_ID=163516 /ORGANISM="Leptocylindrus danicus var. danicus, Strain B650" /LENGTH=700 /DNA_ID=CAMNT_0003490309 /DNA_START=261 /DNA_END=2363 /DNA_ORIENTATION=+
MSFSEVDAAKKMAIANAEMEAKRNPCRKRIKQDMTAHDVESTDCRTGRWTPQETAYVDEIIVKFEAGQLPLCNGIKLNDFLAGILRCKQSRLTKKMKNAKLSARSFKRTTGALDLATSKSFGDLEDSFYMSITNETARAEVRFHMQKEWRELFSNLCANIGQPLDAVEWLSSVEELERRVSIAKDAARHKRRKLMMNYAMSQDGSNTDRGVFIDFAQGNGRNLQTSSGAVNGFDNLHSFGIQGDDNDIFNLAVEKSFLNEAGSYNLHNTTAQTNGQHQLQQTSSGAHDDTLSQPRKLQKPLGAFVAKALAYIQRCNANGVLHVPFEHVDLWVPSFVAPNSDGNNNQNDYEGAQNSQNCRLCFAGCGTVDPGALGKDRIDEYHNLLQFGEYSNRFSFAVGHGLPGRVYQSGIPTWEQSVHNAPVHHFERCGGALQYGVKTVVGIPVPSPNVGCIVVVLYSCQDRAKDQSLVGQLSEEFTSYLPNPRWKLVVDVGLEDSSTQAANQTKKSVTGNNLASNEEANKGSLQENKVINEIIGLLGEHMPSDPTSPLAAYTPGYMTLRLMLLRNTRSEQENEWMRILMGSYTSYAHAGRCNRDIAALLARDFMFLQQQAHSAASQQQQQSHTPQVASFANNMNMAGSTSHQQQRNVLQKQQPVANSAALYAAAANASQQFFSNSSASGQAMSRSPAAFDAPRTLISE